MRSKIYIAALAASAAFASPAMGQTVDTAPAQARGVVLLPLTISEVDPLNFGTVLASATAGSVTIDADSGARSFSGGVTGIALDLGNRGLFNGLGTEDQLVDITLNPISNLTGPGPDILVTNMELDGCSCLTETRTIPTGGAGAFAVGVGGTFAIAANQPNGLYTGAYSVTAEYQ